MFSAPSASAESIPLLPAAPGGTAPLATAESTGAPAVAFDEVLGLVSPAPAASAAAPLATVPTEEPLLFAEEELLPEEESDAEADDDSDAESAAGWCSPLWMYSPPPAPAVAPNVGTAPARGEAEVSEDEATSAPTSDTEILAEVAKAQPSAPTARTSVPTLPQPGIATGSPGSTEAALAARPAPELSQDTAPVPRATDEDEAIEAAEHETAETSPEATLAPVAFARDMWRAARRESTVVPPDSAPAAVPGRRWQAEGETVPVSSSARFAGSEAEPAVDQRDPLPSGIEKFAQTFEREVVGEALRAIGIEPAKVRTTMEIVAPETALPTPELAEVDAEPALFSGATRTIERVLHTAELMKSDARSGVNLRLDFGESGPLNVQITLRNGKVHTMFRSDSQEVRDSLTQAWNAFAHNADNAALPLAEPVLLPLRTANSASAESGRSHDGFAQSDADARSGRESSSARHPFTMLPAGLRSRSAAAATVSTPSAPARSSNHLSVLV